MKKVILMMIGAILFINGMTAQAAIVFDNGEPVMTVTAGNDILRWLHTDDFVLTEPILLTEAHFWTLDEDGSRADILQYFIFANDNGMPGTIISSSDGQNIQKTATGRATLNAEEYEYSFDLETSISLIANDTYWFGLHLGADYPTGDYWLSWWMPSITGSGLNSFDSDGGTMDNWINTSVDHAFYLVGVPEPATVILLGLGGLILRS